VVLEIAARQTNIDVFADVRTSIKSYANYLKIAVIIFKILQSSFTTQSHANYLKIAVVIFKVFQSSFMTQFQDLTLVV
jgi:hypothetical protein